MPDYTSAVIGAMREEAQRVGMRGHVIYVGGVPRSIHTSDIGIPMNGHPLNQDNLYSLDRISYAGKGYRAQRHQEGVHIPEIDTVIPHSVLDNAHDYTYMLHCLNGGDIPSSDAMMDLLNREAVKGIWASLSRSPSA